MVQPRSQSSQNPCNSIEMEQHRDASAVSDITKFLNFDGLSVTEHERICAILRDRAAKGVKFVLYKRSTKGSSVSRLQIGLAPVISKVENQSQPLVDSQQKSTIVQKSHATGKPTPIDCSQDIKPKVSVAPKNNKAGQTTETKKQAKTVSIPELTLNTNGLDSSFKTIPGTKLLSPRSDLTSPSSDAPSPKSTSSTPSAWGSNKKSFADLLKTKEVVKNTASCPPSAAPAVIPQKDMFAAKLAKFFSTYQITYQSVALQPQGLINRGNWCYVNSTLQVLLFCPPFNNLLSSLASLFGKNERGPSSTPISDSLVKFLRQFNKMDQYTPKQSKGARFLTAGSIEPSYIYRALHLLKGGENFVQGQQEDAEELYGSLLNALDEEMVSVTTNNMLLAPDKVGVASAAPLTNGYHNGGADISDIDDVSEENGWSQVRSKNKNTTIRSINVSSSPISAIFRGQIRSIVSQPGARESSTLQPFFTLQLEVQSPLIQHVNEALWKLVSKESLPEYSCSTAKTAGEASRRILLEELPPILTLHLKCFVYDQDGGSQKVIKNIGFDKELDLNKDLLSPNVRNKYQAHQRKYLLFAVVNHHGHRALGGHYTTHFYHTGMNCWLHADDQHIKQTTYNQVTKFLPTRMPYLLFYRRADLHNTKH